VLQELAADAALQGQLTAARAAVRDGTELASAAARLEDDELLMALDLDRLVVPARLAAGAVATRRAAVADVDVLAAWRHDYQVEALHDPPGAATADEARHAVERGVAQGTQWIVEDDGTIRGWNEQNALEIALTPTLQTGKVSWNCKGYPVSAMPQSCGGR